VKRIEVIIISMVLMVLGILIGIPGLREPPYLGTLIFCPTGFALFFVGGCIFLYFRRGEVP